MTKESLKKKQDLKALAIVFTIFDYAAYTKRSILLGISNSHYKGILLGHHMDFETEEDSIIGIETLFNSHLPSRSRSKVTSAITFDKKLLETIIETSEITTKNLNSCIGICVYLILSFEYIELFQDIIKQNLKDDAPLSFGDIVGTIARYIKKHKTKESLEELMTMYIFHENEKREGLFTSITYSAFISVIFGSEFHPVNWKEKKDVYISQLIKLKEGATFIKKRKILCYLLENIESFDKETREEFANDMEKLLSNSNIVKEFEDIKDHLPQSLFSALKFMKPIAPLSTILTSLILNPKATFELFLITTSITGNSSLRLKIIDKTINNYIDVISNIKTYIELLFIAYLIEDSVLTDPNALKDRLLFQVIAKLIWVLHKLNIMYVSLPAVGYLDDRAVQESSIKKNLMDRNFACKK